VCSNRAHKRKEVCDSGLQKRAKRVQWFKGKKHTEPDTSEGKASKTNSEKGEGKSWKKRGKGRLNRE